MNPDPRWLEILKASGWQVFAIALACSLFLLIGSWGWIPPVAEWVKQFIVFIILLTGCLAATSLLSNMLKFFALGSVLKKCWQKRNQEKKLEDYIPHMTGQERQIIGYLLAKNQQTITADCDGGYASTLISRGIICPIGIHGQQIDLTRVPMAIPDHFWKILLKHKDKFPHTPVEYDGEEDVEPWHIAWMVK